MNTATNYSVQIASVKYEYYRRNPYEWLKDCVYTWDEFDKENPVKRFDVKSYIKPIIEQFQSKDKVLLIAKSRQMMMSWLFSSLMLHQAEFYPYSNEVIINMMRINIFIQVVQHLQHML